MRKVEKTDRKKIKVQVCGLARLCDVEWINQMNPDFAAFIFFDSYYRVGVDQAEHLRKKLGPGIQVVGSFSCLSCWLIAELLESDVIDVAHIHGDCTPEEMEQLRRLTDKPLMKTIYMESMDSIQRAQEYPVDFLMYDCRSDQKEERQKYWKMLLDYGQQKRQFFLSDRLCSENLQETISEIRPYGININSPIETRKKRDPEKIQQLVDQVRKL